MVPRSGINDLVALVNAQKQRAVIVVRCQANLQHLVSQAIVLGTTVILSIIFPPVQPEFDFSGYVLASRVPEVRQVKDYLAGLAGERIIIFDSCHPPVEGSYIKPVDALDLMHPNRARYAVVPKFTSWFNYFRRNCAPRFHPCYEIFAPF